MKEITFDDLRQLLLYRRIVKWNNDRIELDNGVKIRIEMTDYDCCAYAAGVFKNVVLDAAITSVSEIEREKWEDSDTYGCRARVTIMHNMNPILRGIRKRRRWERRLLLLHCIVYRDDARCRRGGRVRVRK